MLLKINSLEQQFTVFFNQTQHKLTQKRLNFYVPPFLPQIPIKKVVIIIDHANLNSYSKHKNRENIFNIKKIQKVSLKVLQKRKLLHLQENSCKISSLEIYRFGNIKNLRKNKCRKILKKISLIYFLNSSCQLKMF